MSPYEDVGSQEDIGPKKPENIQMRGAEIREMDSKLLIEGL